MEARACVVARLAAACVVALVLAGGVAASWRETAVFFEDFEDSDAVASRWVHSSTDAKYSEKMKIDIIDQDAFGVEEHGFNFPQAARHYAVAAEAAVEDPSEGIVIQYEVRSREGMDCGGAYLKLIAGGDRMSSLEEFSNETPYSIMFGPDRCGSTAKTHLIIQLPDKDGKLVEHHMKSAPGPHDKLNKTDTQLYRVVITKDMKAIVTSPQGSQTAELLDAAAFEPPVQPPEEIPDADDKKPDDWVDARKIPDGSAVKPDDWDEDLPARIPDEDAVKPEGWLDDEPSQIPDPDTTKPDEWDEDEDGEWDAPMIPNPKCEEAPGCGEWTRPTKANPDYKGKWSPPMIANPAYKGPWEPRKIPNPMYRKIEKVELLPIHAVGIEIWTMNAGVVFDNILIARDVETADAARDELYAKKREAERKRDQKAEREDEEEEDGAGEAVENVDVETSAGISDEL